MTMDLESLLYFSHCLVILRNCVRRDCVAKAIAQTVARVDHPYAQHIQHDKVLKWMEEKVGWIALVEGKEDTKDPVGWL